MGFHLKLYLFSFRLGDHIGRLLALLPPQPRVFVVTNALDVFSEEARRRHKARVYDPNKELEHHGCSVSDLDLRRYFGKPDDLDRRIRNCDLVWVLGGNSFVLRKAMLWSGFDIIADKQLRSDTFAYGGFSAGAVVTAPTLRGIQKMDDPSIMPA